MPRRLQPVENTQALQPCPARAFLCITPATAKMSNATRALPRPPPCPSPERVRLLMPTQLPPNAVSNGGDKLAAQAKLRAQLQGKLLRGILLLRHVPLKLVHQGDVPHMDVQLEVNVMGDHPFGSQQPQQLSRTHMQNGPRKSIPSLSFLLTFSKPSSERRTQQPPPVPSPKRQCKHIASTTI